MLIFRQLIYEKS